MFGFEKLEVWKVAIEFAEKVYGASITFPTDEKFGLTSQIRRAAVSISANIAEGSGRGSNRDFQRFVQIAYGSLMETISHLTIAQRRGFVNQDDFKDCYQIAERIAKMLSRLRRSLDD